MTGRRRPEIHVFADPGEIAVAAAALFIDTAIASAATHHSLTVALAGGSTPKATYRRLAESATNPRVPWSRIHFFWGDERHVPPDHSDSNTRMAKEALLDRVPVELSQIHRVRAELSDPRDAAADYEAELRAFFHLAPGEWPRFDLVWLGLGADGHTASLFPGTAALSEQARLAVATRVEKPGVARITLTAPVINHAARVVFLVEGKSKADAVARAVEGPPQPDRCPAHLINPVDGDLIWLLDRAAASELSPRGDWTQPAPGQPGS